MDRGDYRTIKLIIAGYVAAVLVVLAAVGAAWEDEPRPQECIVEIQR